MIFAPHILQVKVITPMDKDEFGRPIPGTGGEYWQEVCKCRCDDNTTKEFSSDNGSVYRPNYHVVCEKRIDVGDEAVKYAEENGDYQDHTLTLRTSNDYDVDKDGLTLKNEAEYASFVESKGYDVLSSAALYAEKRLKEEFEK